MNPKDKKEKKNGTDEKDVEEKKWKNRSLTWLELGMLYSPDLSPAAASRRLKTWVKLNAGLVSALKKKGCNMAQRILTPGQVGCIVRVLGEP